LTDKFTEVAFDRQFEKDLERINQRGSDLEETLKPVMKQLIRKNRLDPRYNTHKLAGEWSDHWECHIKHDWLLIWHVNTEEDRITFVRTGTHDDLFR
jgi:mRNA interferase YafQ